MTPRHEDRLTARIEEAVGRGWSYVAWHEAYLWFNADRLGKRAWRDIKRRFHDCIDDDESGAILQVYEDDAGFLLVYSGNKAGEYMKPIDKWMGDEEKD